MLTKKGEKREYFPKVKVARELLRERAEEIFEAYMELAAQAKSEGKLEVAEEVLWKLIEHMPHEEGDRMIDSSAAKPKEIEGKQVPVIQIGIQLGPNKNIPKELPPHVIEAEVLKVV